MHTRAILFSALFSTVFAYSNTSPLLAWSSHSTNTLSSVSKSTYAPEFIESLLSTDSVCEHDAVVLVDQAGLHASDLRALSPSSALVQKLVDAPSSLEVPYMRRSFDNPLAHVARAVAERCGSRTLTVSSGELSPHIGEDTKNKHVVCLGMPKVHGSVEGRKQLMAEHGNLLSSDLETISAAFPKHLVVYAGWISSLEARQSLEDEPSSSLENLLTPPAVKTAAKSAPSNGGILKRYQLLTPGLIVSLLIAFFVLVPIVYIGIASLASIQSPVRLDAPKGFNAAEKKNQ